MTKDTHGEINVRRALGAYKEKVGVTNVAEYEKILFRETVSCIANRIPHQNGKIPNESAYMHFLNQLKTFTTEEELNAHETYNEKILKPFIREPCLLKVTIEKARNLAPKDVNGSSDPYCLLGISHANSFVKLQSSSMKNYVQRSNTISSSLFPEWKQEFVFKVNRSHLDKLAFHVHVWDEDSNQTLSSSIGAVKDVKGVFGMGRYMKDVITTASGVSDKDDFMGFATMALSNIPFGKTFTWLELRPQQALQSVSGDIQIGFELTCPHHSVFPDIPFSYNMNNLPPVVSNINVQAKPTLPLEILFGGLATILISSQHQAFIKSLTEKGETVSSCKTWDGKLHNVSERLLQEFSNQIMLAENTEIICKWHIYTWQHNQLEDGISWLCIRELLNALEERLKSNSNTDESTNGLKKYFKMEELPSSFDEFIKHEKQKLIQHRELYPIAQNDTIERLGEVLLCFGKLRKMSLFATLKIIDSRMTSRDDVVEEVSIAFRKSSIDLYNNLCQEFNVFDANTQSVYEDCTAFEEYSIPAVNKFMKSLNKSFDDSEKTYQAVCMAMLKIDYIAILRDALTPLLFEDLNDLFVAINRDISKIKNPTKENGENNFSKIFELYGLIRSFASLFHPVKTHRGNGHIMNHRSDVDPKTLEGYHNWFRPTLLRWLQQSHVETLNILKKAVLVDKVDRMDDIVKHSSSSVDAVCHFHAIVKFWHRLNWPDVVDSFVIITRLTTDLAAAVEHYADLIHDKLKSVGFFDDEGQFDCTEELCLALNNVEKVRSFLQELPEGFNVENVSRKIDLVKVDNLNGSKFIETFNALLRNADAETRRKMLAILSIVGKKFQPDIIKYLDMFSITITGKKGNGEEIANIAAEPLMKYLEDNVMTLHQWLYEHNFQLLLEVIWRVCLQAFQKTSLENYKSMKPSFFKMTRYILTEQINNFFYADGIGIPHESMQSCEMLLYVEAELNLRSAKTVDLMRLFYADMYDKQQKNLHGSEFGNLIVESWYESETLHVHVLSAENLVPLDKNGQSDPFVQLRLAPTMMFPDCRTFQTLVVKSTLNPVFNDESFSYKLTRSQVEQEGAVIIFTVFDHDIFTMNDLEGEAVLPLHILQGVASKKKKRHRLALSQPKPSEKKPWYDVYLKKVKKANSEDDVTNILEKDSHKKRSYATPLSLLQHRENYDRDAAEFCRWRLKLEQAMLERT